MLEAVWSPSSATVSRDEKVASSFSQYVFYEALSVSKLRLMALMFSINSLRLTLIWCFVGHYTISAAVSPLPTTLSCALLPSLIYFKPLEGEKGMQGRDRRWLSGCKNQWTFFFFCFFSLLTTCGVSLTRRGRTWNKAENERVKWMHGYGRVTTKRQRDRKSVGGRNGDQYATTVGRGGSRRR